MTDQTSKKFLFIINDAPYGNERPYNALRLAHNLVKREGVEVRVFLTGDGVLCARQGQKTPDGYYNITTKYMLWVMQPPSRSQADGNRMCR